MLLGMLHNKHHCVNEYKTLYGPQVHLGKNDSFLLQTITLRNTIKHSGHVKHSQIGTISLKTIVLHTLRKKLNLKFPLSH